MTTPRIDRRRFLRGSLAAGAAVTLAPTSWLRGEAPSVTPRRKPNLLFLTTDQWHADVFSHAGNPWVRTPHSDRIFASGLSFSKAYAAHPVCTPARTSWMTGRMPEEHRVAPPPSMPDAGQWFRSHGYETVHLGKWDVGKRNPRASFDLARDGHAVGQYCDHGVAEMARSYLLGRRRDKPFFMHVGLMNPHDICQPAVMPTAGGVDAWQGQELPPLPANFASRPGEARVFQARLRNSPRRIAQRTWTEHDWRVYAWLYYRYCEMADSAVGLVLDTLEASGELENTLLVYTSDHGESLGQHGLATKGDLYEASARVPLVVSRPGEVPAGRVDDRQFVSGIDILPALCAAARVPTPPAMTGVDFLGEALAGRRSRDALVAQSNFGAWMVRDDRHKLIRHEGTDEAQLFDLASDPGETANLASSSTHASTLGALDERLSSFRSRLIVPSSS